MIAIMDGAEIVWAPPHGGGAATKSARGTRRKAPRTRGPWTYRAPTRSSTSRERAAAAAGDDMRPQNRPRADKGFGAHAGTRRTRRAVERTRGTTVTGRPGRAKSRMETSTPSFEA